MKTRTMNKAEQQALARLFERNANPVYMTPRQWFRNYLAFRRTAYYSTLMGCWLTQWCGMTIGIERDGCTHS